MRRCALRCVARSHCLRWGGVRGAAVYFENLKKFGKVDEIFGPVNEIVSFVVDALLSFVVCL